MLNHGEKAVPKDGAQPCYDDAVLGSDKNEVHHIDGEPKADAG